MNKVGYLICGDTHIPRRATAIPPLLLQKMEEVHQSLPAQKFEEVLFTGDLVNDPNVLSPLKPFVDERGVEYVSGNMDYQIKPRPAQELVFLQTFDGQFAQGLKLGLIHGHQIQPRGDLENLTTYAKELEVNILVSGHTHADCCEISEDKRILLLNPGSLTGAWSFLATGLPSFQTLILTFNPKQNSSDYIRCKISTYYLQEDEILHEEAHFSFQAGFFKTQKPKF